MSPLRKAPCIPYKEASTLGQTGFDDAALSMEPAPSCCEQTQSSFMQVPGLLGRQLLTSKEAPVLTEHPVCSAPHHLFIVWGSVAMRAHGQEGTDEADSDQT